ncbi:hypothetical protein [Nonomuraea dietziae]|uniref:Integral membrane protein n=1 Tax=Nonomuraea dietziae TaxID=65515 RepID=A0A7W5V4X9_9ACTN|nr:hypothetical protein [Nonomuraea dietziae]MBB3725095.1 hypothetical protein [Nonomuraea dietziae]
MWEWFAREVAEAGKLRLFCFFVLFLCTFLFIRISVRMIRKQVRWWPGNVTPGGMHIHHVVFGLVFMCLGGIGGLAVHDGRSFAAGVTAALFGVGTALVLDEFALVLHLDDVYWTEQGRFSVDTVFMAIALCGLGLVGVSPLEIGEALASDSLLDGGVIVGANILFAVITLLKGKVWTGLVGIYLTPLALVGAVRLGRPGSPWARWRYRDGSRKLRRAERREQKIREPVERFKRTVQDLVAGRPTG